MHGAYLQLRSWNPRPQTNTEASLGISPKHGLDGSFFAVSGGFSWDDHHQ